VCLNRSFTRGTGRKKERKKRKKESKQETDKSAAAANLAVPFP
jgi:hypothetical protein